MSDRDLQRNEERNTATELEEVGIDEKSDRVQRTLRTGTRHCHQRAVDRRSGWYGHATDNARNSQHTHATKRSYRHFRAPTDLCDINRYASAALLPITT